MLQSHIACPLRPKAQALNYVMSCFHNIHGALTPFSTYSPLGLQISSVHRTPRDTPRPTQMARNDTVGYFYSLEEIDFSSDPELRSLNWKVSRHTANQEGSDILECS